LILNLVKAYCKTIPPFVYHLDERFGFNFFAEVVRGGMYLIFLAVVYIDNSSEPCSLKMR
jgi:hypothetical protein